MDDHSHLHHHEETPFEYLKLFIVIAIDIFIAFVLASLQDDLSAMNVMRLYMASLFITFAGFKLVDIRESAESFRVYDLVAKQSKGYAYIYPFLELTLGILYLFDFLPVLTNITTLIVMSVGSLGVINELRKRRKIRCACLGKFINLPLTKVSLLEDVSMAVMAGIMLVLLIN